MAVDYPDFEDLTRRLACDPEILEDVEKFASALGFQDVKWELGDPTKATLMKDGKSFTGEAPSGAQGIALARAVVKYMDENP